MKKITYCLAFIAGVALVCACGAKKESTNTEEYVANESTSEKPTPVDVYAQGEALVKGGDCNTCHHKINKIIGPSHTDVAKKYDFTEASVKLLADKIIRGGVGVWGDVPMNAHADITQTHAETMARYILSLDGEKEH